MTPEQRELWRHIQAFEIDVADASLPFSARLARENNWSGGFTQRAIEEYKRFVFLAMCAGHPVAPSEEVDQVWHLHLTYTRSYWDELCGQILPRPLHHGPTQGGREEGAKFHDWYARTLESYRQFFGTDAPPDLWPNARVRFAAARWVRVDARRNWIIGKPQRRMNSPFKRAASTCSAPDSTSKTRWSLAALALLLLMAGCDQVGQAVPVFDWNGPQFLMFYLLFAPSILLGAYFWRRSLLPAHGDVGDHKLPRDPYVVAFLNGGENQALQAAIAELARRREIDIGATGHISCTPTVNPTFSTGATANGHPLEAAILQALGSSGVSNLSALAADSGVQRALNSLKNNLRATGFAIPEADAIQARNATLALAMVAPLVGVIKIFIGVSRDRPVGFLVVLSALALLTVVLIFTKMPFRNARGDKALMRLRLRHTNLKTASAHRDLTASADVNILPLAVGLYGLGVLSQTPMADLHLQKRLLGSSGSTDGGSSSGCGGDSGGGSGCGGSGCGGGGCGGGGCGGCGGGD